MASLYVPDILVKEGPSKNELIQRWLFSEDIILPVRVLNFGKGGLISEYIFNMDRNSKRWTKSLSSNCSLYSTDFIPFFLRILKTGSEKIVY